MTSQEHEREREIKHIATGTNAPRVDNSLLIMVAAGMMEMATGDDSPSSRVPEQGLD